MKPTGEQERGVKVQAGTKYPGSARLGAISGVLSTNQRYEHTNASNTSKLAWLTLSRLERGEFIILQQYFETLLSLKADC